MKKWFTRIYELTETRVFTASRNRDEKMKILVKDFIYSFLNCELCIGSWTYLGPYKELQRQ